MAEFLTTSGTSHYFEQIIIDSKEKLFLVSPYLKLSKTFYERLKDASLRNVPIRLIYGKDELSSQQWSSLKELPTIQIFFFENLHAKCYFNERQMVITSMNMYEFSEKNNREMGILINSNDDQSIFDKATKETQSIIQSASVAFDAHMKSVLNSAKKKLSSNNIYKSNSKRFQTPDQGYCIRCEIPIQFDSDKPLCSKCFNSWVKYQNPSYIESACHCCGNYNDVSVGHPLCYSCYKKLESAGYFS